MKASIVSLWFMYLLSLLSFTLMKSGDDDFYKILKVLKSATEEEIKKSYRQLAKQYHPDKNDHKNAVDKFIKIQEAYETLSDPSKRKDYDDYGNGHRPNPFQSNSHASQQYANDKFFQQQSGQFRGQGGGGRTFTMRFGDRVFVMENGGGFHHPSFEYSSSSFSLGRIIGILIDLTINLLIGYYILSCLLFPRALNRPQQPEEERKEQ